MVKSSDTADDLYRGVGSCLQAWGGIEMGMADLFLALHDKPPQMVSPLRYVFEGIQSFEVRLSILNISVVTDRRNDGLFAERWKGLYGKIGKQAKKRAEVAHYTIVEHALDTAMTETTMMLRPFFKVSDLSDDRGRSPLTASNLREREIAFGTTANRLRAFVQYIWIMRERPQGVLTQLADPARLLDNPNDSPTPIGTAFPPEPSLG